MQLPRSPLTRHPRIKCSPQFAHFARPSLALSHPLALLELELIEPALFFGEAAAAGIDAAGALADALAGRLQRLGKA